MRASLPQSYWDNVVGGDLSLFAVDTPLFPTDNEESNLRVSVGVEGRTNVIGTATYYTYDLDNFTTDVRIYTRSGMRLRSVRNEP